MVVRVSLPSSSIRTLYVRFRCGQRSDLLNVIKGLNHVPTFWTLMPEMFVSALLLGLLDVVSPKHLAHQ
jgi:hypothetical protein